ncbi:MAG: hypothetical protein ACRDQZ_04425, partial [Mycobacteriales bacterium]
QGLWDRVSAESDAVASAISDIARLTVAGHETRTDLQRAGDLLEQASGILEQTAKREGYLYAERARLLGDDPGSVGHRTASTESVPVLAQLASGLDEVEGAVALAYETVIEVSESGIGPNPKLTHAWCTLGLALKGFAGLRTHVEIAERARA